MEITITKKHCEGASYRNPCNCPLARALKEQGFEDVYVGGSNFDVKQKTYIFDCHKWNMGEMENLERGIINSITLEIPDLQPIKSTHNE